MRLPSRVEMLARRAVGRVLGPAVERVALPTLAARRASLLRALAIDALLDVGANIGQYGAQVRLYGYRGALFSFEPLLDAYETLATRASGDSDWHVHRTALGRTSGEAILHIAGNSQSSSLREMLPRHEQAARESAIVGEQRVGLTTLRDVLPAIERGHERCFVKIDAQGSERDILDGAGDALSRIAGLELELSLVPLYAGETLFADMIRWLSTIGFELRGLTSGLTDPRSGEVLQVDALFARAG